MTDHFFIELASVRLECIRLPASDPRQPSLVLLHEGLGCVDLWKDFPRALAQATGCEVIAYSRQGYGRSSPVTLPRPLDYLSVQGPDEYRRVLEALDLDRVVTIGHSDGGSIALAYAARNDPRVLGTVALAPHVDVEEASLSGIRRAVKAFERGDLRERLARYQGANVSCAFDGWSGAWLDEAFRGWHLLDELARIERPVLAAQGCEDEYATARQMRIIERTVTATCSVHLIEHCRHFPQNQARDVTLELIRTFLGSLA